MNNMFKNIAGFLLISLMIMSCKKEGRMYVIEDGQFKANALVSASNAVVLAAGNENDVAVGLVWQPASFGENPVIKYTVEVAKVADTSGINAWTNIKTFVAGNNITVYDFIVKDINTALNGLGLAAGIVSEVAVRVKAELPQYNGAASTINPVYSNTIVIKFTPYSLSLYIPGEHQGWDPATAPELRPVEGRPGMYEGYIYFSGTGTKYFKYTNARDWNHINYGDGGNGSFSTDGAAAGLSVPDGGYYEVTADLNTNKWTATRTTWSILGDATPGGWNNDTQLSYNPAAQVWTVTCDMVSNGSFKFRANNAWVIDFGIDATGKLVYADNPFLGYTPNLNNLTVPSSGNYTITLDLHESQQYSYILHKN